MVSVTGPQPQGKEAFTWLIFFLAGAVVIVAMVVSSDSISIAVEVTSPNRALMVLAGGQYTVIAPSVVTPVAQLTLYVWGNTVGFFHSEQILSAVQAVNEWVEVYSQSSTHVKKKYT